MMIRTALVMSLIAATSTACAPRAVQPGAPGTTDALARIARWNLQSATDAAGQPMAAVLPDGEPVHALVFRDGMVAIEGGCNHMGGDYRIDAEGRLVVQALRATRMACPEPLMAADSAVAGLLQGSSDWRIAESYPEQLFFDHADGRRSQWVAVRPEP